MKIELTAEDRALDVRKMYEETNAAVGFLGQQGMKIPEEAYQMQSLLRRCVVAEETLRSIREDAVVYLSGTGEGESITRAVDSVLALQSPATAAPQPGTAPPSSSL